MTQERRSSVRVRSLLPCAMRKVEAEEVPVVEAKILDAAVLEAESVMSDKADWSERTDDIPKETVFLLKEIRALRQQIAGLQTLVERQGGVALQPRWVVINDNGLFLAKDESESWSIGDLCEIRVQIPSLQNPDIVALGEVVRVGDGDDGPGVAIIFRHISEAHSKAILRYALRRERQGARSLRFKFE